MKSGQKPTRILIVCPYPSGSVPGQRFRYEQYLDRLRARGFEFDTESFLDARTLAVLYLPGHYLAKSLGVLRGFARRLNMLRRAPRYDFVFLFREASPIGPPIIEWALFMLGCRVIYDFDDAIFIAAESAANPFMPYIRCAWKVGYIARKSYTVSVCNPYLAEWARKRNAHVELIPTTIDEEYHRPQRDASSQQGRPVIGWTGSHSTVKYLDIVRPVLAELQTRYDFDFRVICDQDPGFPELTNYRFIKWRRESEIEDLASIHIGLMPVPAQEWALGKVGFKAIQYSALGIASVVSSVGSGPEVIIDGETGFVVENDPASWTRALETLLGDSVLLRRMGENARRFILKRYSVSANVDNYLRLFEAPR